MPIKFSELEDLSEKTKALAGDLRKELGVMPHKIEGNFIAFFGRQFNPGYKWNTVLKPLWSGFYIKYDDLEMMIDPGVNILERAEKIGINLARVNTLFISHGHIDHGHDADVVAEMFSYGFDGKLRILISERTDEERILRHYHFSSGKEKELILIDKENNISLGKNIDLLPIKVLHSIDGAYGFILNINGFKIGYTGDTGFCTTYKSKEGKEFSVYDKIDKENIEEPGLFNEDLKKVFSETDYLVFNLHDITFRKNTKHNLYHSTINDAIKVLSNSKIEKVFLEHFNPHGCMGEEFPKKVAKYIEENSGKESILIPLNGHIFNLNNI